MCIMVSMTILTSPGHSEELEAIKSTLPDFGEEYEDKAKQDFLAARYAGFTAKEAVVLANVDYDQVKEWREDDTFKGWEDICSTAAVREVRQEVLRLLFSRNYFLVLRKDYEILAKANSVWEEDIVTYSETGEARHTVVHPDLTEVEQDYLNTIRRQYTPQQLSVVEKLVSGDPQDFNISQFILQINQAGAQVINTGD